MNERVLNWDSHTIFETATVINVTKATLKSPQSTLLQNNKFNEYNTATIYYDATREDL